MSVLLPLFIIIFLGYLLRRVQVLSQDFWAEAERATYYIFFPCLLVGNLAMADFGSSPALPMAGALVSGVLIISTFGLFLRPRLSLTDAAFSSFFQGTIRPNTYVGIAGAVALAGPEGVTLAAIAIVSMIPLVNLLCVPVVAHFGNRGRNGVNRTFLEILKNPLILSCLLGILLNVCGVDLPAQLYEVIRLLGRAALPLGLLSVGAGLQFTNLHSNFLGVAVSSLFKLLLLPAVTTLACYLYHVTGTPAVVAVLFASLPASVSSFILARQLGGDEQLIAVIITVQTLLATATLPLTTYLVTLIR